ncbi:YbjQ family protein [Rhizobium leguminosarum]|nr:YbjQ family protein [Rhizobium leguminosarum]
MGGVFVPNCSNCGKSYYLGSGSANTLCIDCRDLAEQEAKAKQLAAIVLTTSIDVPNRKVESVISIIAAEAALGMNIFRDIANNWRDFVGGRSNSSQKSLREARLACLDELRREAAAVGADAVIAVDLDYNELSTSGSGGILFVAASGTAVKLAPL